MSNSIIEVMNLAKSYTITHEGRKHIALYDVVLKKTIFLIDSFIVSGS